jgi:hypothetical protein
LIHFPYPISIVITRVYCIAETHLPQKEEVLLSLQSGGEAHLKQTRKYAISTIKYFKTKYFKTQYFKIEKFIKNPPPP